jgi:hypothetical protein
MPLSHTLEAVWGQQQRKKENRKNDAEVGGRSEAFTEKQYHILRRDIFLRPCDYSFNDCIQLPLQPFLD